MKTKIFLFTVLLFSYASVSFAQQLSANASADQTICFGQCASIGGSPTATGGAPPYTYMWSTVPPTQVANPTVCPATVTIYTVTVTDALGSTASDNVVITVNPLPVANAGNDQTICAGASVTLNASGGTSYSWSPAATLSFSLIANPVATPVTTITYTVTISDGTGCSATDDVTITVYPLPTAFHVIGGGYFCSGGSGTAISIDGSEVGVEYQLFINGVATGLVIAGSGFPIGFGNQNSAGTYAVVATSSVTGCSIAMTGSATLISDSPQSAFTLSPDSMVLHHYYATNNASGVPPLKYLWSWGDGTFDSIAYPAHTYNAAGYYKICLTITDSAGCMDTYCDSSYLQKSPNSIISVEVIPQVITGISVNEVSGQMKIYPNPAINYFTIDALQKSTIEILNINGQTILQQPLLQGKTNIDITGFTKGIYILRMISNDKTEVTRFIKE